VIKISVSLGLRVGNKGLAVRIVERRITRICFNSVCRKNEDKNMKRAVSGGQVTFKK
jgi:hypothetical protein